MPAPTITVTAYFDFPFTADAFTLDDPTRGELGNTTYKLFASTPVDVSNDARTVSISRGTSSKLVPEADAGTASVVLANRDRTYDPQFPTGPYYGNIIPGRRVTIAANDITIFDGRVEDWDLSYEVSGESTAVAKLVDGLATLARQQFDDWTPTAGETAGPRLSTVLDRPEVQWPYARSIDTGVSTLSAAPVDWGTNALDYCKLVSKSDLGFFFADRSNVLTFRDRHANLNASASATFADDGTGIPFMSISAAYGSELLFNRVGVSRVGGGEQTVLDLDAQLSYGVRSYTVSGLLLDSNDQALDMANFLLGQYTDPEFRIESIGVELAALTPAQQDEVLSLDLTSVVRVVFTPNGVAPAYDRFCIVYGIDHAIDARSTSHTVTLHLGDADRRSNLTLDDDVFGRLDSNVLAF